MSKPHRGLAAQGWPGGPGERAAADERAVAAGPPEPPLGGREHEAEASRSGAAAASGALQCTSMAFRSSGSPEKRMKNAYKTLGKDSLPPRQLEIRRLQPFEESARDMELRLQETEQSR